LLAQDFLHRFAAENGRDELAFDQDAIKALSLHDWPGNVRELENRIKRAVIMAEGKRVTAGDLEFNPGGTSVSGPTLKEAREAVEREMIRQVLREHRGKMSAAAAELGISRPTLYELMEKLGMQRSNREAEQ
jgi:two-component system NtrC family response regulator